MGSVTIPNRPSGSDTRSIAALIANFDAITDEYNDNIDATNLAVACKPATIRGSRETVMTALAAFASTSPSGDSMMSMGGGLLAFGVASTLSGVPLVPINAAEWAISGLTTKLRLRVAMATNAVSSTRTFNFGLYPVSTSGGTGGTMSLSVGSVINNSLVGFTPGASFQGSSNSAEIDLP